MKGKRLPQVGRVEVSVLEESNPRLLAFSSRALDMVDVPRDLVSRALDDKNRLLPAYASEGVTLQRVSEAGLAFFAYFNMNDPVVGGYAPERIALRRAVLMGYNVGDMIKVGLQGQGTIANQPIPPEVPGHVAGIRSSTPYDPALARTLLDKFGYKDRDGDGFRELPDGKPLTLSMGSAPTGENRIRDELWLKNMRDIGIRIEYLHQKWPDLLKMSRAGQLQMWQVGWSATSADSFMELAYGPERRRVQPVVLQECRIRRPLSPEPQGENGWRARQALCTHDRDRCRVRADGRRHLPHREHAGATVGQRLQERQLPDAAMAFRRCRSRRAQAGDVTRSSTWRKRDTWLFSGRLNAVRRLRAGARPRRIHGERHSLSGAQPMSLNPNPHSQAAMARVRLGWCRLVHPNDSLPLIAPIRALAVRGLAVPI